MINQFSTIILEYLLKNKVIEDSDNPVVPSGSLGLRGEAGYYSVSAAGEWTP